MNKIYYHSTGATLRNGEPVPPVGEWLVYKGEPIPCKCGLHAYSDAFDALQYAPGEILHQVELDGLIVPHGEPVDKFAAQKRKIIASIDATKIMRLFARRVALDVIHLWNAPPVVREYLMSGEESKRDASWDAAWAAVWTDGLEYPARDAAWAAVWTTTLEYPARDAAWDAASYAAWASLDEKQKLYRSWFNEMVEAEFEIQKVKP